MNIKQNTPNEIVYIESGFKPLKAMIYKRQLKFFRKYRDGCLRNNTATTSNIFFQGVAKNITFLRHYRKLDTNFVSPEGCYDHYAKESIEMNSVNVINKSSADINSLLGTYYRINPELKSPDFYEKPLCLESDRKIISQYRMGSHELRIQRGRINGENRNQRLCTCNDGVQSVEHMLFFCSKTENIRRMHNYEHLNLTSFFKSSDYKKLSDILKSIDEMK